MERKGGTPQIVNCDGQAKQEKYQKMAYVSQLKLNDTELHFYDYAHF